MLCSSSLRFIVRPTVRIKKLDTSVLTTQTKTDALDLGFELVGVCPAVSPVGYHRFLEWLDLGYAGEMHYLPDRSAAYQHPDSVLNGVRSVVMLGINYHTQRRKQPTPGTGNIATYAWGEVDYHDLIHDRLKRLKSKFLERVPNANVRGVVDTAPLLEREFAQLAGLGWIGKNTLLLNREQGSYFFLAALLTDAELKYDDEFETDHCGTCTACLDACPTNAFPQPYVLDARRCISYLTIEHRNEIDDDLKGQWDQWLFGCDICQEVCPWNNHAPRTNVPEFQARENQNPVDLAELFYLNDDEFRNRFRKTPLWRSKRRGILRNAALVLGAQKATTAREALQRGERDSEELVRSASSWALAQLDKAESS